MTTNDKTRDVLRLLTLAVEQNRNCDFNSEHPAVESAMKEAYAALASTPAQPAEHRPGCDALGGYGYGVGVCDCGAVEAQTPVAAVPEGWTLADALYRAGYEDRSRGRDYDPRGCLEWQSVVDAIHPHSAADSAQGGATGVSNAD